MPDFNDKNGILKVASKIDQIRITLLYKFINILFLSREGRIYITI